MYAVLETRMSEQLLNGTSAHWLFSAVKRWLTVTTKTEIY